VYRVKNLQLGCLDQPVDGWLNTDITPHILVARIPLLAWLLHKLGTMPDERYDQHRRGVFKRVKRLDLTRRFAFADESFDNAFSAHVLEHLYREDAERCVREVHRVLKTGGVFRITVPDLDRGVAAYDPEAPEPFLTFMYETHEKRDKNRHHWMYNEHSLGRLLREAGFSEVQRRRYREGRCPDLDRLDNRPEETLFMEAVK
jgi:predicted SAM-dependent methyltransferase